MKQVIKLETILDIDEVLLQMFLIYEPEDLSPIKKTVANIIEDKIRK